jgi:hypothetical protein
MRVLMKQSRRPGFLHQEGRPLSLKALANIAGTSTDEARPLLEELTAAGLCCHSERDGYFSPRIVAFDKFRRECGKAGKRGGGNPALRAENKGKSTFKGSTFKGGSKGRSKGSPPGPSPPVSPSPTPPSSSSPPPEEPGLSTTPAAGGGLAGGSLQERVMADVWEPMWAAAHYGEGYAPARVDFVKLAEILGRLGCKRDEAHAVQRFRKIAATALAQPEEFGWQGHRLPVVEKNLSWLISETAKAEKGAANAHGSRNGHKPAAAANRPGECEQSVVIRNVN